MRVAIHQPAYLPYPGFFHKLSMADVFVIMDDVQYDKRFTNRNRILVPQGPMWISVPIVKSDKFQPNMLVEINNSIDWRPDHLRKISNSYANAPFFHLYQDYLKSVYSKDWELLFDLDFELVKAAAGWLGIKIPMLRESELKVTGKATERLVNTCKAVGADTYISGIGGKNYLEESSFSKNGLSVVYQNYRPFPYRQRFATSFVPDLSIIDMLFNLGPDCMKAACAEAPAAQPALLTV
jgi:WbqC-like protein